MGPSKLDQVEHNFKYHAPDDAKKTKQEEARTAFKELALKVLELVPEGCEQSLVITVLEEGLMWANAGIARN